MILLHLLIAHALRSLIGISHMLRGTTFRAIIHTTHRMCILITRLISAFVSAITHLFIRLRIFHALIMNTRRIYIKEKINAV